MSVSLDIDGQRFHFPDDWQVLKYDDSAFHRNQFQSFAGGAKAVDAVALSPTGECWLIEVKDYRRNRRSKPGSVFAETAGKVRATLAGMATARAGQRLAKSAFSATGRFMATVCGLPCI